MEDKHVGKGGFTLVELMVVVAIIGVLAAMAIPDYMSFTARSRQAEAKMNLGGIFTAELGYFAEFSTYTGNLALLGWSPQTVNKYVYDFGGGTTAINNICYPETRSSACWLTPTPINFLPQNNVAPEVTQHSFTVIAYANIDADFLYIDTWQINDVKDLQNTMDDSRMNP